MHRDHIWEQRQEVLVQEPDKRTQTRFAGSSEACWCSFHVCCIIMVICLRINVNII